MSTLREALDELRTEVAGLHDDAGLESSDQSAGEFHAYKRMMNRLNELLAAHPVEPAAEIVVDHRPGDACYVAANIDPETGWPRGIAEGGGITDDAVVAAANALLEAGFVDPDDGTIPQWHEENAPPWWTHPSEAVKVALEAALPLLGLQQVPTVLLDRNAVRLAIADELDGEGVVSYGLAPKLTDRVMDVAQQVPSREEIAEAMHDHWTTTHKWRQGCREDVCIEIFLDRADAVLALFSKPAEEGS